MSNFDFSQPQRQSRLGLVLIFATSLFHLARNLWFVVLYFFVQDFDLRTLVTVVAALVLILILTLGYSVLYFMRFKFNIDEKNEEFILQKGVFSTDTLNIPFNKIQQVNFKRNILQRILGVYSVQLETAGSQEKEVEIKALSKEKANVLADRLMSLSRATVTVEDEEELINEAVEENDVVHKKQVPEWEHQVNVWTLVKLGLTSNYLRGLGLLVAFYFTLREQFMLDETLPADIAQPEDFAGSVTLVVVIFFLIIGMIITVAKTVIEYYGLDIKKFKDSLQVEMGLRNNTRVNLRANRVQVMQVLSNPLQQRLNLFKLKIFLASSENDLDKSQIKIPGLPKDVVSQIKRYFYNSEVVEKGMILPNKILLIRKIFRSLIPMIIGLAVAYLYQDYVYWGWVLFAAAAYLLLVSIYNYLYFKTLRLFYSDGFLIKKSGVWVKSRQYIEMFRLQSVSVSQPIWYKRRGLVSLTFHSAGGDIYYPVVKQADVQPLLNYVLYKIESTARPWM